MSTFSKTYESTDKGVHYHRLRVGKVSKPLNTDVQNPYHVEFWQCKVQDTLYPTSDPSAVASEAYQRMSIEWDSGFGPLRARCYDNLYRKASGGKRAAAALTLVDWKSSLGMIAGSAGTLLRSANYVRRGNFVAALKEFNVRDPARSRRLTKKYGDGRRLDRLWLELNFGWAPLIDDMRQICATMSQEVPVEKIMSRASGAIDWTYTPYIRNGTYRASVVGVKKLQYMTHVMAVNPNLLLAKQLGLTNPVQVVWDAVPMSFVVDWFLPVNKYLSSLDLSLGITLGELVTSKSVRTVGQMIGDWPDGSGRRSHSSQSEAYMFDRTIGSMPTMPSFRDRLVGPSGSLWQATTTAALALSSILAIKSNRRL